MITLLFLDLSCLINLLSFQSCKNFQRSLKNVNHAHSEIYSLFFIIFRISFKVIRIAFKTLVIWHMLTCLSPLWPVYCVPNTTLLFLKCVFPAINICLWYLELSYSSWWLAWLFRSPPAYSFFWETIPEAIKCS